MPLLPGGITPPHLQSRRVGSRGTRGGTWIPTFSTHQVSSRPSPARRVLPPLPPPPFNSWDANPHHPPPNLLRPRSPNPTRSQAAAVPAQCSLPSLLRSIGALRLRRPASPVQMDSADVATPLGAWASIRGYFTPATLFLVVNIVIGTIVLTSRATQQRRRRDHHYHDDGHGHYHFQYPHHRQQQQQQAYGDPYYHNQEQQQQPLYYATPPPAPAPAPLVRTSSVLDRLRSFGLYRFRSGDFPPEYAAPIHHAQQDDVVFAPVEEEVPTTPHYTRMSRSEPAPGMEEESRPVSRVKKPAAPAAASEVVTKAQVAPAPARVVEAFAAEDVRAEEFSAATLRRREPSPLQQEYHHYQEEEYVPPPARAAPAAPAPLARTSSFMDRIRSVGFPSFLGYEQQPSVAASTPPTDAFVTTPAAAEKKKQAHAHYDRSRSEPAWEQGGSNKKNEKKQETATKSKMAKSSSETRKKTAAAPTTLASAALASESVDARAEAFIDSFKQQQAQHHREYVPPPAPLARAPSVLERLCSFSLSQYFLSGDVGGPADLTAEAAATPAASEKKKQAAGQHYARSRSEPAPEQGKKEPRMSKSSSSVVEEPAEQGVDARADDFINKFRQQLQLQRLNSLLNYKEVLGRGKQ
ncbi:hypothetical protein HU200_039669 [Digitaria exilis]|uniref:DUF4408 domain-containing protein n=1 Tax=Digitaria exilis TaxID=1010633 RepID=A0A835BG76_9POAL|nr:hypothetical protein HU200_039669 [Digitaria exilis]CAB3464590.1 unnamed protein product [Digitaria exilis]